MNALIDGAKKRLALHGPDRVLVDNRGTAVSAFRAKTEFSTEAEVVLIRADGWMLGAPWKLRDYAFSIWKNEWAHEIAIVPDNRPPKPPPKPAPAPGPAPAKAATGKSPGAPNPSPAPTAPVSGGTAPGGSKAPPGKPFAPRPKAEAAPAAEVRSADAGLPEDPGANNPTPGA